MGNAVRSLMVHCNYWRAKFVNSSFDVYDFVCAGWCNYCHSCCKLHV